MTPVGCGGVNLGAFRELFGESIRAWLAWDELEGGDAGIRQRVITDRAGLGRLLTVWYADPVGGPGDWRESAHAPMTVEQAVGTPGSWKAGAAERVEFFSHQFTMETEPPVLLLPAFGIGDRMLLLDGSHRAIALLSSGLDPRVLVCAVDGPVAARVLPDLERWSSILE